MVVLRENFLSYSDPGPDLVRRLVVWQVFFRGGGGGAFYMRRIIWIEGIVALFERSNFKRPGPGASDSVLHNDNLPLSARSRAHAAYAIKTYKSIVYRDKREVTCGLLYRVHLHR